MGTYSPEDEHDEVILESREKLHKGSYFLYVYNSVTLEVKIYKGQELLHSNYVGTVNKEFIPYVSNYMKGELTKVIEAHQ